MSKSTLPSIAPFHQIAALPWRRVDGRVEFLLVTTRETKRWTIPKGWPMKGKDDRDAARIEAEQEAGVTGRIGRKSVGCYLYWKRRPDRFDLVRVEVYPLKVQKPATVWREQSERDALWMVPEDAATAVDEPDLATLLRQFGERRGRGSE